MVVVDLLLYCLLLMAGAYVVLYPISKFIASRRLKKLKKGGWAKKQEVEEVNRSRVQSILSKQSPKVARTQKTYGSASGLAVENASKAPTGNVDVAPEPDRVDRVDRAIEAAMKDYEQRRAANPNDPVLHPEKDLEGRFDLLRSQYGKKAVIAFRPYPPRPGFGGRSKLGGKPDLPPSAEWPRAPGYAWGAKPGTALHFLLQIDLRELPYKPKSFPESGVLLFFGRVDEEMIWAFEDASSDNDIRIIHDVSYAGVPTDPPADLQPIRQGRNGFDDEFNPSDQAELKLFPQWPLQFAEIETLPFASDLPVAASPGFDLKATALRNEQLTSAFGVVEVDSERLRAFSIFDNKEGLSGSVRLRPYGETRFPYSPRGVELICRKLLLRHATLLDDLGKIDQFEEWKIWAQKAHNHELSAGDAQFFIDDLNELLAQHKYGSMKSNVERAIKRVIAESGSDEQLSQQIPFETYMNYAKSHPVCLNIDGKLEDLTSKFRQEKVYHQFFGYPASAQDGFPVREKDGMFLELFSENDAGFDLAGGKVYLFPKEGDDIYEFDDIMGIWMSH